MIRILVFLTAVLAAGLAAVWIAEQSGTVSLVVNGVRYETPLPVAVIGIVALTALFGLIIALIRRILGGPEALSIFMRNRRRNKGLHAVTRGFVAIGIGDERGAVRAARDARKYLPGDALTGLLAAQTAQLSGDRNRAEQAFRAMLDNPETRPLGLRGLFIEARRRGDSAAAIAFAEETLRTAPEAPWAGPALLEYHCAAGSWAEAIATVERNTVNRVTPRSEARRQRAVLLTAQALAMPDSQADEALALASEALKLAPDLVPAAALAGRLLAETGEPRRATRVVESTWRITPHPDLAEVYLRARPGDTAQDRLKRARALAGKTPDEPEAALMLARAALDARAFDVAREALKPLVANGPSVRTCLLMAELEETGLGDRAAARGWLARAASARRDPAWVADGFVSATWSPVSPVTGELDAFRWKVPPESLSGPRPVVDAPVFETVMREPPSRPEPEPQQIETDPAPVEAVAETEPAAPPPEAASPKTDDEVSPSAESATRKTAVTKLPEMKEDAEADDEQAVLPFRAPDDPGPEGDPGLDSGEPRPRTPAFGPP